jgi:DNA-binding transcriptional LysR family regulator
MEKELGFSVMKRNKGGITLTEEGKRIYQTVKDIVDGDKKVKVLADKIKGQNSNSINIATFSSVAVKWLPNIMNGFKKLYPETQFSITDGNYDDVSKALEDGVADIGFVTLQTASNMKCHPLVKDRILAILPKTHLLANLEYLPVEAFSKEPVISLPEETDFDSRKVFANAGIKPNILYRTNDDYAMISMVENGLGICLVPELLLGENNKVAALETNPPSFRTIALAIPYEKHASPLVLKLQDYILNWVKENCKNSIV